jgi:hypothetical protein
MKNNFTEKDIEEMLCILEFDKMQAENYRHTCNFPNVEKTYSQIENEKLWMKIRKKK